MISDIYGLIFKTRNKVVKSFTVVAVDVADAKKMVTKMFMFSRIKCMKLLLVINLPFNKETDFPILYSFLM